MPLDIDVMTSAGIQKITLEDKRIKMTSDFTPVIDPKGYFLKTITSD
jgi:hypothetical protein